MIHVYSHYKTNEVSSPVDPPPEMPLWACVIITLAAAVLFGEALWLIIQGTARP